MNKGKLGLTVIVLCSILSSWAIAEQIPYGFGEWDSDTLGNHRAVIHVYTNADVVQVRLPWRRRDHSPEKKNIIIVDATSGKKVLNLLRLDINREFGHLLFQPQTTPGDYYVYYLIPQMEGRSNYPTVTYPGPIPTADGAWAERHRLSSSDSAWAQVKQFQAIDPLNSFYPMEVIATSQEIQALLADFPSSPYLIFPEDRKFPIRMINDLPMKWIQQGPQNTFLGEAARGEYYTFQIGLYACRQAIDDIAIKFSSLKSATSEFMLPDTLCTCFNTRGIDWTGKSFDKTCAVKKGQVQALWCGIQVPMDAIPGKYTGMITVAPHGLPESQIQIQLQVSDQVLADAGDSEPERHSRLRWLNSTLAFDDGLVPPYVPVKIEGQTLSCLGRKIELNNLGLPNQIRSYFTPEMTGIHQAPRDILAAPIRFIIQDGNNQPMTWKKQSLQVTHQAEGIIAWKSEALAKSFLWECDAHLDFDGYLDFKVKLTPTQDTSIQNIRLEIPMHQNVAKFMMGMGQKGGYRPAEFHWQWNQEHNQDSVWLGDVNAGLQAGFRDNLYSRPLNTNFYLIKPLVMPSSWWNQGKGGCDIVEAEGDQVVIQMYSGFRKVKKGEILHYYFHLLITPFRPINPNAQWDTRFYHRYEPVGKIKSQGANTINVHHATEINPYINYPFLRPQEMKAYIDEAHKQNMKVKIYYTVRELTNRSPELFALRSLGNEIFFPGKGGGFSWLQEHLGSDYIAAWFVPRLKDAAIINSGVSRWHNYYLEGLNWLVKNVGIDGLYIDDVAFDRTTMKRVRKILDRNRPGALIDLHSANQFNVRDGFANSANLYLEHFPYIDRLWFGEYFDYNAPPEFWLVEMSGIPFGLMGEMLQDGGNAWRGMLYGMTSRLPWAGDPSGLWKVWDDFGIQDAEMFGYWSPSCPIQVANAKNVKITAYVKSDTVLIAIASWESEKVDIILKIDWQALALNPENSILEASHIPNFQEKFQFDPSDPIPVESAKGWLLVLKNINNIR